jgi:hypothetical protein
VFYAQGKNFSRMIFCNFWENWYSSKHSKKKLSGIFMKKIKENNSFDYLIAFGTFVIFQIVL